jgi:hypothetical protein
MGYCIYITRADHPVRSKTTPILESEWKSVVASDPALQFEGNDKKRAIWLDSLGDEQGRMLLHNGHVVAKNPSPELIDKMKSLALLLSATVRGDDGEAYS